MNGTWSQYNEQYLPSETRQNYPYQDNVQTRARGDWLARVRADRQKTAVAPYKQGDVTVTVLPDRQSLKLTRLVADKEGYAAIPARKAEIVEPHQPPCVLCNRDARAEEKPTPVTKQATYSDAQARKIMSQALDDYPTLRDAVAQELARRMAGGGR